MSMSKKWMCEKIASTLDTDRDGKITNDEAKTLLEKVDSDEREASPASPQPEP